MTSAAPNTVTDLRRKLAAAERDRDALLTALGNLRDSANEALERVMLAKPGRYKE